MYDLFGKMVSTQAVMLIYMVLGLLMVKTRILKPEGRASLIHLLIYIALPCMSLHAFEQKITSGQLFSAYQSLLVSLGACLLAWALGKLLWRRKPSRKKAALEFATLFSNAGNAGLPIVSMVFGEQGVIYASFFLIPIRVLMWTLGVGLFSPRLGDLWKKNIFLNPCLLSLPIGFVLLLMPLRMPVPVSAAVANMGAMTAPLSMMLIGSTLADCRIRDVLDWDVCQLSILRLLLLPLVSMAVMRLCQIDTLVWQVATVLLAMPAATNTAIFSEMYGYDHGFASQCVFTSTLLSLITVPLLTLLY